MAAPTCDRLRVRLFDSDGGMPLFGNKYSENKITLSPSGKKINNLDLTFLELLEKCHFKDTGAEGSSDLL